MSLSTGRLLPILAFLVALLASATVAGGQQFNVRVYTENDGLPSSTVADLAQDPSGAMWFLTRAGLVLYDGASWERFVSPARPDGDGAVVLAVSPDGHLWTADRRGHLFSADPTSGEQWRAFPDPNLGEAGQVLDLAVVPAVGSPLVAMAAGADGLWIWHERWQHYLRSHRQPHGVPDNEAQQVLPLQKRSRRLSGRVKRQGQDGRRRSSFLNPQTHRRLGYALRSLRRKPHRQGRNPLRGMQETDAGTQGRTR